MDKKIEILAPAGSVTGMRAAFAAGADAVYIGGQQFGARAYAVNAGRDELLDAIDEAHLHGKKLYLTVNTLLKNQELYEQLADYLYPYYAQGLDAVLVQDYGVLSVIRELFPDLPVHASTQMTVCGPDYGLWLKQQGVSRLVLPRELGLDEIREMKDVTGAEIEVFVHGALCYCYSGQCLMSSMIGGRSGNRGRCAQPCRLAYQFKDGRTLTGGHLLSMKDLCALSALPDLIDAGVDSFKIEGRMKKPEYAALTSRIYRHYTDIYLEKGLSDYRVDPKDIHDLMDLYSRGGFTGGYTRMYHGAEMITPDRPNHSGTVAGTVKDVQQGSLRIHLREDLHAGDVLELPDGTEIVAGQPAKTGSVVRFQGKYRRFKSGQPVLRTKNARLISDISGQYVNHPQLKEKLYGFVSLLKDSDAIMELNDGIHKVRVTGARVTPAMSRPLTEDAVRKQMEKTGATPYIFGELSVQMDADIFLPVGELNALRRKAFDAFQSSVCGSFRRSPRGSAPMIISRGEAFPAGAKEKDMPAVHVLVSSSEQLKLSLETPAVRRIYMDLSADRKLLSYAADATHRAGKAFYPALPHVWRRRNLPSLEDAYEQIDSLHADGFLVRNIEGLFWLRRHGLHRPVIADAGIYMMNDRACLVGRTLFDQLTMPYEQNRRELSGMKALETSEVIVYGEIPLMISAQCVLKTCGACEGVPGIHLMTDRMGKAMKVRNICRWCYNVIGNPVPLFIPEVLGGDLAGRVPASVRLQFTDESAAETRRILETFTAGGTYRPAEYTKGHYKRGVE